MSEDDFLEKMKKLMGPLKCPICGRPTALHVCVRCMYRVVGYHVAGQQYCLPCFDKHEKELPDFERFPIKKGDPDWGWGSVPFCVLCGQELPTLEEDE